jgi:hypothetical protein
LDCAGRNVGFLQALEELRGGEEDEFCLRLRGAASNVHFQPESCKVVKDEFHPALQVLPRPEWKGAVVPYKHCSISYAVSFLDLNIVGVWLQIFPSAMSWSSHEVLGCPVLSIQVPEFWQMPSLETGRALAPCCPLVELPPFEVFP